MKAYECFGNNRGYTKLPSELVTVLQQVPRLTLLWRGSPNECKKNAQTLVTGTTKNQTVSDATTFYILLNM